MGDCYSLPPRDIAKWFESGLKKLDWEDEVAKPVPPLSFLNLCSKSPYTLGVTSPIALHISVSSILKASPMNLRAFSLMFLSALSAILATNFNSFSEQQSTPNFAMYSESSSKHSA